MPKVKLVDLVVGNLIGNQDKAIYELQIPDKKGIIIGRRHDSHIQIFKSLPEEVKKALDKIFKEKPKTRDTYYGYISQVSRSHSVIYRDGNNFYLQDLGTKDKKDYDGKSKNKTYIGRERIEGLGDEEFKKLDKGQKILLKNRDVIAFGINYKVRFICEEPKLKLNSEEAESKKKDKFEFDIEE